MVFQVILNVTRRPVVLVEFFVSSVSPCFRLRPMRCAIRRGKGQYGSYDNGSLISCSAYMAREASREGTRERTHSSHLSRAAVAWLLAITPNGCSQAKIMMMISLFSAHVSIRKLWQLLPPLIIVLTAPVHPMVSKPCRQSAVQWSYTEVESLSVTHKQWLFYCSFFFSLYFILLLLFV